MSTQGIRTHVLQISALTKWLASRMIVWVWAGFFKKTYFGFNCNHYRYRDLVELRELTTDMHGMKRISVLMFLKIAVYNVHLLNMRGQKKRVMKSLLKNVSSNIYKVAKFCFLHVKRSRELLWPQKGIHRKMLPRSRLWTVPHQRCCARSKNRLKKL